MKSKRQKQATRDLPKDLDEIHCARCGAEFWLSKISGWARLYRYGRATRGPISQKNTSYL